jgi:hypothetical protein
VAYRSPFGRTRRGHRQRGIIGVVVAELAVVVELVVVAELVVVVVAGRGVSIGRGHRQRGVIGRGHFLTINGSFPYY